MARADAPRERIGEMLLSLGLITRAQLEDALKAQGASGLPIGKQLVALGSVSETRLTQVLSNQLSVPWVSLERVEFPAELLARIPAELADRRSVMPIYVRGVRGRGATLYVAMDDPTDEEALKELADVASMPVRPMIAPPSEIRRVIERRYFGAPSPRSRHSEPSTGLRAAPKANGKTAPVRAPAAAPTDNREPVKQGRVRKPPPPPDAKPGRAQGVVAMEQYEAPSQPPTQGSPQRTLTLLDGTQIKLPSGTAAREVQEVRAVRHVVKAIRSASPEQNTGDPLSWHDIVHVLLAALDTRGIRLNRKEIADAWLAHRAKRDSDRARKS